MPPSTSTSTSSRALNLRRQHNLLLLRKILEARDGASPFTLVLDTVEQSARGFVGLCVGAAKASKTDVVFVSYETLKAPVGVEKVVWARRKGFERVRGEIEGLVGGGRGTLLILDTLHPLATSSTSLPHLLTSLLSLSPTLSLLALYHTDIPLPFPSPPQSTPYNPHPLPLLTYLATTILTLHNPTHLLTRIHAREKCIPEPLFGVEEGRDGVLVGMRGDGRAGAVGGAFVLEMEYRRKSGRAVCESFFIPANTSAPAQPKRDIILLDDHPLFSTRNEAPTPHAQQDSTFELHLTAKQRAQREGVVLPFFDAQRGEGPGEGGRILYDLGTEDDFDEEEDEDGV